MTITQTLFLFEFKQVVDAWTEAYKADPNAEDPIRIWFSGKFERDRMAEMAEGFQGMAEQVRRHNGPYHDLSQQCEEYCYHRLAHELKDWFKTNGYDYENIPKAPAIDHDTLGRLKAKDIEHLKDNVKSGFQLGQITYTGSSNQQHGWGKLYYGKKIIARFYPATHGLCWDKATTEAIWRLASKLSALTDWSVFEQQPKKVIRALGEKVKELVEQEGLGRVARYG